MYEAVVNFLVAIAILLAIAIFFVAVCQKKEVEPRVKSSCDPDIKRSIDDNRLRIESLMHENAKALAVRIVGKYMQAVSQAQTLSVSMSLDEEVSPELLDKTAELLITKGWEVSNCTFGQTVQLTVTPVPPRKTLQKHRPVQVIGGARYWG